MHLIQGSNIKRSELERLFHFLILENILKDVSLMNNLGFANNYIELGCDYRSYQKGTKPLLFPFLIEQKEQKEPSSSTKYSKKNDPVELTVPKAFAKQMAEKRKPKKTAAVPDDEQISAIKSSFFQDLVQLRNQKVSQLRYAQPKLIFLDSQLWIFVRFTD